MKNIFLLVAIFTGNFLSAQSTESKPLKKKELVANGAGEKKVSLPFVIGADYTFSKAHETMLFVGYTKGSTGSGGCGPAVISATSAGLSFCRPHNLTGNNYYGGFFQQDFLVVPTPVLFAGRADLFYSPQNKNYVFRPGIGMSFLFIDFTFTYSFSNKNSGSLIDNGRGGTVQQNDFFPSGPGFTIRIKGFTGMGKWED
ncbi:MAG: hypothetical protein IAF38_10645 [Bacteroidia bacterium]|nr:hypothetical protein [Bacteroidia bacterium]